MSKMIRKQLYMQEDQDKFLKAQARERSITEAEVVREALDIYQEYGVGVILDQSAWLKEREFLMKLSAGQTADAPSSPKTWTREELYER